MNEKSILEYGAKIQPLNKEFQLKARAILENKVKPLGSLGILEDLAATMAGIYGCLDFDISRKADVIFCGDNGVFEEGFNKYPQQISRLVAEIMAVGKGGGSLLARTLGAEVTIVNLGLKGSYLGGKSIAAYLGSLPTTAESIRVVDEIICPQGTGNITKGAALSRREVCQAMTVGIKEGEHLINQGIKVITAGEIGLGNTTTSAAILAAFTGAGPKEVTGMGSGTQGEKMDLKIASVAKALAVNKVDAADAFDVMAKLGGLDIAAMAGLYLACGYHRIPIVLDGFISLAAALCASRIQPHAKEYMILSHHSAEKGAALACKALNLTTGYTDTDCDDRLPPLHLGMRLGEGSGAVLMFPILDCAKAVLTQMASFTDLDHWFPHWQDNVI